MRAFLALALLPALALAGGKAVTDEAEKAQILKLHNQARADVGVAGLVWDEDLAKSAENGVNHSCKKGGLAHDTEYLHSHHVGENLAWKWASNGVSDDSMASGGTQGWLDELKDYDYESGSCKKVCGHYTQCVWENTQKVGCAIGNCGTDENEKFLSCHYDPAGNYVGQKPYQKKDKKDKEDKPKDEAAPAEPEEPAAPAPVPETPSAPVEPEKAPEEPSAPTAGRPGKAAKKNRKDKKNKVKKNKKDKKDRKNRKNRPAKKDKKGKKNRKNRPAKKDRKRKQRKGENGKKNRKGRKGKKGKKAKKNRKNKKSKKDRKNKDRKNRKNRRGQNKEAAPEVAA